MTRLLRRCPRTWPHAAHGPWRDGRVRPLGDVVSFDCPGVPVEAQR